MDFQELLTNGEVLSACPISSDANLRVMTSNILASCWGEDMNADSAKKIPPYEVRSELYARVLESYLPDLIGVQESDLKWLEHFPKRLEALEKSHGVHYEWLHTSIGEKFNMTTILYRTDRYRALETGYEIAPYWLDPNLRYHKTRYYIRGVMWGLFESVAEPEKRVVLINTHWTPDVPTEECISFRKMDVKLQIDTVNRLRKQYGVPIFCTGDFNTKYEDALIRELENGTGVCDLYTQAIGDGTLACEPCGGLGPVGTPHVTEFTYDHIFGVGDYKSLRYEVLTGGNLRWLSDHSTQVADIRI